MKRAVLISTGFLAVASGTGALASASQARLDAHPSRAATVSMRHTSLGGILVSSSGRTLYEFTRDRGSRDSCVSISRCAESWPPLRTSGHPSAGSGVRSSLLSTITLPGGAKQVTYAGHPLYLYSQDSGPGETYYIGAAAFGGSWLAINASGRSVK